MKRSWIHLGVVLAAALSGRPGIPEAWAQQDPAAAATVAPTVAESDDVLGPATESGSPATDAVDSWFNTGFSDLSLNKLNLILPSFIRLTPESRLDGDLNWDVQGLSVLSLNADATVTGIRLNHPRLASKPVLIPDLRIKGIIRWNRAEKTVSFENFQIGRQGVMLTTDGRVAYQGADAVSLTVTMPDTDLQTALNALPADLIPKLQGARVQGRVALNTVLSINPAKPQEFRFDPGIRVSDYQLIQAPPAVNLPALKSPDYVHEVWKGGMVVRRIPLSSQYSLFTPYEQLDGTVLKAILKAEDAGFFKHRGFDLEAMRAAMVLNLADKGRVIRGGSTISMQLVKNLFLSGQKTIARKIEESLITYALEREVDKKRILEIYANIIEWGDNVYGIAEAANHYYSKAPTELTPAEAAQLASIIPNPRKRDFNKKEIVLY